MKQSVLILGAVLVGIAAHDWVHKCRHARSGGSSLRARSGHPIGMGRANKGEDTGVAPRAG